MTFLAPLFLIGAALIAGPIIAHLIRRSTKDRIRFSSTDFLQPSPPRLQRRSRIENWWLLVLRCLIVLLLTIGFARPFLRQEIPAPAGDVAPQHLIVVLDTSASMRREGLWTDAVVRAREAAAKLGPQDRFALLSAGGDVGLLISGEQWSRAALPDRTTLVAGTLEALEPGWGPTRLDSAIDAALDELASMSNQGEGVSTARILVISDATAGARLAGLAGRAWPPDCVVEVDAVENPQTADASLQWLGWTTDHEGTRAARVRLVEHSGRSLHVQLHLRSVGEAAEVGSAQSHSLAPRETRVVLVPVPPELAGAFRLDLTGDEESFNNTLWLVPPQPRELTISYFGAHDPNDSSHALFYLTRAVSGWRDPKVALAPATDAAALTDAPLIIVADVLEPADIKRVHDRIAAGSFALVLLRDPAMVPIAASLVGESGWTAASPPAGHALLGSIDFQHPLFALFADPRYSDFSRVRFWKPVPIELPEDSRATVVARFDRGAPAIVESTVGQGRVIVWGGDWSNVASQWVLSTKFVPWLQALIERATGGAPRTNVAEIGAASTLVAAGNVRWLPGARGDAQPLATAPTRPGVYRVVENDRERIVALQVPAAESRNDPLPLETWEQLGVPLARNTAAETASTQGSTNERERIAASDLVTEQQQKYWRWLLLAAVLLLAIESAVALRATRQPQPQTL